MDKVVVIDLDLVGTIVEITYSIQTVEYLVRYFYGGELKKTWLYDFEFKGVK